MAEEQRCQEAHRLCANNCGFFGSPATLNLCSKCYRDHRLKEEHQQQLQASSASKVAVEKSLPASDSSAVATYDVTVPCVPDASLPAAAALSSEDAGKAEAKAAEGPSRCASCRKRVGLTGFVCRCGATFCGTHRYAERHGCAFDFKAAGRSAIARANPVVKADKLHKI